MASLIFKISSKYTLKNIFSFIPLNICYNISRGSTKLTNSLEITKKNFQIYYEIKKIINPSYDINKYLFYINKKHLKHTAKNKDEINLYKRLLFDELNSSPFNVILNFDNNSWQNLIKYIHNFKLVISFSFICKIIGFNNYLDIPILKSLNKYKNNLREISFSCLKKPDYTFISKNDVDIIIMILTNIFKNKENNDINNNNQLGKKEVNKEHNIKKLSFIFHNKLDFLNISDFFLNRINDIISLNEIEECEIDSNSFSPYQFANILSYFDKNMNSLKYLKIINFGYESSNYINLKTFFINSNEHIEKLEIKSNKILTSDLFPILNLKKYPIKELKINSLIKDKEINWDFLENNINNLEVLELDFLFNINPREELDKLIIIINKMQKLRHLKLIGGLEPNQLLNFNNFSKIEYFYLDLYSTINNFNEYKDSILNYFINFQNLKSLTLVQKKYSDYFIFNFPPKLNIINLINNGGNSIIKLLQQNNDYLNNIEQFKIDNVKFENNDFILFFQLLKKCKSLIKLSINNIKIYEKNKKDINIYDYIDLIKSVEVYDLNISNNESNQVIIYEEINSLRKIMYKKLINLNFLNEANPLTTVDLEILNHFFKKTKEVIDLNLNYQNYYDRFHKSTDIFLLNLYIKGLLINN